MWRKGNPHALVRMQTGTANVDNSMEVLHKLQIELKYDPASSLYL